MRLRNFLNKVSKKLFKKTIFYKYSFDNIKSNCNYSFIEDQLFKKSHNKSIKKIGKNYKFYFRNHQLLWSAYNAREVEGSFFELGTGKGYLFISVAEMCKLLNIKKKIYLFDTFLPFKTSNDDGNQSKSNIRSDFYAEDYIQTKSNFKEYKNVSLIKGKCPSTLQDFFKKNPKEKISLLHVDLNFYKAEIDSLNFLWNYISRGAFIVLDDYANPGREKQNIEFDKFFNNKNLQILTTATGQGIVIKN